MLLAILTCNVYQGKSQNYLCGGLPYIQNFTTDDYQASGQCWTVVQDSFGVLYVGNGAGIIEFDGNYWQLITTPNKSAVRSLAITEDNVVYVGAQNELGYLLPDSIGKLKYHSLLDKIPKDYQNFEDVWKTLDTKYGIVFQTGKGLYIYKNNKFKFYFTENICHTSFYINKRLYVRITEKGLFEFTDNGFKIVPKGEIFNEERIYAMLPYKPDTLLLVTRINGLLLYNYKQKDTTQTIFKPLNNELNHILKKNRTYCGTQLSDNEYAIGTLQKGVYVINRKGEILYKLREENGLNNNMILNMQVDRHKNLWLTTDNGISHILHNSPLRQFNHSQGLSGAAYNSIIFKDELYVGTSQGAFVKKDLNRFVKLTTRDGKASPNGQIWFLKEVNNQLLFGHYLGLYEAVDTIANKYFEGYNIWMISPLQDTEYMLAGTYRKGLLILERKEGIWTIRNEVKGFEESTRFFQQDGNGYIWVTNDSKGVYRMKLNNELDSIAEIQFYDDNNGLPAKHNNFVFKIKTPDQKKRIIFATENGIYNYSTQTDSFYPDTLFRKLLGDKSIDIFVSDDSGNIWYQEGGEKNSEKGVICFTKDSVYLLTRPFRKIFRIYAENINPINRNSIFFNLGDVVVHFNKQKVIDYFMPYKTLIRTVYSNDSLLIANKQFADNAILELPYEYNTVFFRYSAAFYENMESILYSYKLEGFEDNWSEWSVERQKEYTNLREGTYTFKIKAKNIYGIESEIDKFTFQILPPWYRTWTAYIIYLLSAALVVFGIVKFYTRRLRQEKIRLERIVRSRTHEIEEQKQEILKQKNQLEEQKEKILEQTQKLHQNNEQLRELDKFKQGLMEMIVHDLKNPLNLIIGLSSAKTIEKNKEQISQAGKQMLNMVLNILDVQKFENTQMKLNNQNHTIYEAASIAISQVQLLLDSKSIELYNRINENCIAVFDFDVIVRVFTNLLTNAQKYSNNNGIIDLKCEDLTATKPDGQNNNGNNFYRISISDTGVGIPSGKIDSIFDKFAQVDAKNSGIIRSTGLGLTFCKIVIEAHGGSIGVESELQKGSTFWFTLPKASETKDITHVDENKTPVYTKKELELKDNERKKLNVFLSEFQDLDVYEYSRLRNLLNMIDAEENENIIQWKQEMGYAITYCNEEKYKKLLQMINLD